MHRMYREDFANAEYFEAVVEKLGKSGPRQDGGRIEVSITRYLRDLKFKLWIRTYSKKSLSMYLQKGTDVVLLTFLTRVS